MGIPSRRLLNARLSAPVADNHLQRAEWPRPMVMPIRRMPTTIARQRRRWAMQDTVQSRLCSPRRAARSRDRPGAAAHPEFQDAEPMLSAARRTAPMVATPLRPASPPTSGITSAARTQMLVERGGADDHRRPGRRTAVRIRAMIAAHLAPGAATFNPPHGPALANARFDGSRRFHAALALPGMRTRRGDGDASTASRRSRSWADGRGGLSQRTAAPRSPRLRRLVLGSDERRWSATDGLEVR